jgi:hypothetical protein
MKTVEQCDRCEKQCDTLYILPSDRHVKDCVCWDCIEVYKKQYKRFMQDFIEGVERRRPWVHARPNESEVK